MILYTPFYQTLKNRKLSSYKLIHQSGIIRNLTDRLRYNKPIGTVTVNNLCRILSCNVQSNLEYIPEHNGYFIKTFPEILRRHAEGAVKQKKLFYGSAGYSINFPLYPSSFSSVLICKYFFNNLTHSFTVCEGDAPPTRSDIYGTPDRVTSSFPLNSAASFAVCFALKCSG